MAAEGVAVLLMAYGGPGRLDDVEPYLQDVRGGRPTAPELVAEIRSRYARIGGRSPIRERTDAQAEALGHALGPAWPVYVGMRHWHPFIQETVERIVADGQARVVAIALAPHYSALSVGAYEQKLLAAAQGRLELALVRSWGDHPKFLEAVTANLAAETSRALAAEGDEATRATGAESALSTALNASLISIRGTSPRPNNRKAFSTAPIASSIVSRSATSRRVSSNVIASS